MQIKCIIDEEDLKQVDVEVEKGHDDGLAGQLSLNAIWGARTNHTMMLRGLCNKVRMHILVDTKSTHNFIHEHLVQKLKLPV